jgi:pimeloyl-ACP methyl ester carboxylesterase
VLGDGGYFCDLPTAVEPADYVNGVMGPGWLDRLTAVLPSRDVLFAALQAVPPFRDSWSPGLEAMFMAGLEELPDGSVRNRCSAVGAKFDSEDYFTPREAPYVRTDLALVQCPVHLVRAPRGFDISPETTAPLLSDVAVDEFAKALPQLVVETVPNTNHYTVNFGEQGVVVLAESVRKALR